MPGDGLVFPQKVWLHEKGYTHDLLSGFRHKGAIVEYHLSTEFFESLGRLVKVEQRQVRETIQRIIADFQGAGLRLHKIEHPSKKILSFSSNKDLRIIAYRENETTTFLYTNHHDAAYEWINRRRFISAEGAIRIVLLPVMADPTPQLSQLTAALNKIDLLSDTVARSNFLSDDEVLEWLDKLPLAAEQKNAVLERVLLKSSGYKLLPKLEVYVLNDDDDLAYALEYPLDLWRIFLHPKQQEIAEKASDVSQIVTGGPGTGKTVCLVHRAVQLAQDLAEDEIILFSTFKDSLVGYVVGMLSKLNVDPEKVVVIDVVELDNIQVSADVTSHEVAVRDFGTLEALMTSESKPDGCLLIHGDTVWLSRKKNRLKVAHLLVDECQDYRDRQLVSLREIAAKVPHTIAFDYTQSIYRPSPSESLLGPIVQRDQTVRLDYCYRLNRHIINRMKAVVGSIQVLASFATEQHFRLKVLPSEGDMLSSLMPAFEGAPPLACSYQDDAHLEELIRQSVAELQSSYATEEIVLTNFFPEIYKHPRQSTSFGADQFPDDLRSFYRFVYTLKGQEYKAGIIVLDDSMSELLNLNQLLFTRNRPNGFKGNAENVRRMYNLLYVSISRFRDFLAIFYPAKYELILNAVFRDIG